MVIAEGGRNEPAPESQANHVQSDGERERERERETEREREKGVL